MLPQDGYPLGAIPCAPGDPGPVIVLEAMPPFPGQPWSPVACAADAGSIRDELVWHAGRAAPGTVWRSRRGSAWRLLAVTGRGGAAEHPPPLPFLARSWWAAWFGRSSAAHDLLVLCRDVDHRTVAAAACGVASRVSHLLPAGGAVAAALETATAWAAGAADLRLASLAAAEAEAELAKSDDRGPTEGDDETAWTRSAARAAMAAAGFAVGVGDAQGLYLVGPYAADALARSSGPTAARRGCGAELAECVRRVVPFGAVLLAHAGGRGVDSRP